MLDQTQGLNTSKPMPHLTAQLDPALTAQLTTVQPLPGVRAGSGLLRLGSRLLAIQDDAHAAVWINPQTLERETLVLEGSGEALRKRDKPDYESLLLAPDGRVYVLGSGSRRNRYRIASLHWPAAGGVAQAELREATPLYLALAEALDGEPNIEGALFVDGGTRLRLLHRGAGDESDAWLDLAPEVLSGAAPQRLAICRFALGALAGVPLHFSDAALLPDGGLLYLAAAENTKDAIADGPVAGAAIGVIGGGTARWAPLLESSGAACLRKAEGLALNTDGRSGYLITDPDDPTRPAELCGFVLKGPW